MIKAIIPKKISIETLAPVALAFLSGSLPLFFPIGQQLEYESTLITSWSFFIITILWPWKDFPSIKNIIFSLPFLFLSPFFAFSTDLCGCSNGHFLTWSLINTLPSWFLTYGFAYVFYKKNIWKKLFFLISVLASILITLWFFPQKRMISIFAGYLHGPIYDEWIGGSTQLIFIRYTQACLGVFLFLWFKNYKKTSLSFLSIWIIGIFFQASQPEFNHGHKALQKSLPTHYQGNNWTLYTSNSKNIDITIKTIHFHVEELQSWFPDHEHIHIYQYPSSEIKKRWFGGHYTDVADVVTPSLHITNLSTLRHELVHAMSAKKAFHGLGFHPNIALTEGLAVALAPTQSSLSIHDASAYLLHSGKIKNPKDLFSPYFWSHNGQQAYTVAGSFLLFIAERTSQRHVLKLYEGQSLITLTGRPIEDWVEQWKKFLRTTTNLEKAKLLAQRIFREPSLWKRRCTHSLADLRQYRNSSNFFKKMMLPLNYAPEHHGLWREVFTGASPYKRTLLKTLRYLPADLERALNEIQKTKSSPPKVLEDIRLTLLESDLHFLLNQKNKSEKLLENLLEQTKTWNIGGWKRHILARRKIDEKPWRLYLAGWGEIPKENDKKWIHHWLRLRSNKHWPAKKIRDLEPHKGFEYAWFQTLGKTAKHTHHWQDALTYFEKSLIYAPSGHLDSLQQDIRFLKKMTHSH
ncbi:MAG: hypothetical protein AB8C84_09720 [Oligoflexales bacterium]